MRRLLLFGLLAVMPFFVKSQQNTFNEIFQTFGIWDITELPNGEFFLTASRHGFTQHWGVRAYRLSSAGIILDSVSIWTDDHEHYTGRAGHQLLIDEDSTLVTFWWEWHNLFGSKAYITKWQVYPSIDTLLTEELNWNYLNMQNYLSTQTLRSQDDNIVSAGLIFDTTSTQTYIHAHLAKYDLNLNVLWETKVPCANCQYGSSAMSVLEAPDGVFVLAGSTRRPQGLLSPKTRT